MFFKLFRKKEKYQSEYIELVAKILRSPLWNGDDRQIKSSLPSDLSDETIDYVKKHLNEL